MTPPPGLSPARVKGLPLADSDLRRVYHLLRAGTSVTIVVAASILGLMWGRSELRWVALAAALAAADALVRTRKGRGAPLVPLALDTVAVGGAMVVSGLPLPVMGAPLAYLLTAAVLLLAPRAALFAVGHTTVWMLVAVAASSWSPIEWTRQEELVLGAIATAVFFAEMALLISAAARALRQRHEALAELVRSKDEFVASVSHELRTPLTAVLGFAEELRERRDHLSHFETGELLDLVVSQCLDLAHIVEDLLAAARLQVGTLSVLSTTVSLGPTVHTVIGALAPESARVVVTGEATCHADPLRVRQILRNLMSNALRYGGAEVAVAIRSDGDHALIEVVDDGPGIPAEAVDRVFQAYQQFHHDQGKPDSVGLGLFVSRSLARLMDGDLTYRRRSDRSVFTLTLPGANGR